MEFSFANENQTQYPPGFFPDNTYEIISTVAYLIGVPLRIFENQYEPPKLEIYKRLERNKNARIIRNLCMLRTSIERNFKNINDAMQKDYKSLTSLPDYVPQKCIFDLQEDGVSFLKKSSTRLCQHIIELNRLISDRINNCKTLFPLWLNWQYVRDLFLMPDGLTEEGTKAAAAVYYGNLAYYPYQVYLHWTPEDKGNILYCDKKFVELLYAWNNDYFFESSKVSDAGTYVKNNIYDYINESEKTVVVVDCENSDPYKLCAALTNLDFEIMQKIQKIILFDDIHTTIAWQILEHYTRIPVEHMMVERVKSDKSLVDVKLTSRVCREFYQGNADSFIIVSSDSDYWGLIDSIPDARFLMMVEREKYGHDMKESLEASGIFYCYLDDFYTGNSEEIKQNTLFQALNRELEQEVHFNINTLLDQTLRSVRIAMSLEERKQFIARHMRTMQVEIDDDGNLALKLYVK